MSRPLRVFLCHASQDKPAVWKMYRYLKQRGIQPWLDQADLLPGQNWEVEIPSALFASDVILVCISKNSVNKEGFVQKEIAFALDKAQEKPEGTIFVIPVRLEECEVPRRLGMYQWVDYFRPDGRKRLLLSLSLRADGLDDDVEPVILEDTRRRKSVVSDLAEREAVEKLAREKVEQDAKEKADREAAQKAERERKEREAAEQTAREVKETARRQADTHTPKQENPELPKPKQLVSESPPKLDPRLLWLGGVIVVGLLYFGITTLLNNLPANPPETTATLTSTYTGTSAPTKTATSPPLTRTNTPRSAFTPTPGIGSTMISEKDGMILVIVPAGEFTMGSTADDALVECQKFRSDCQRIWSIDEEPVHKVYLDTFWIDQIEVTNAMYANCVKDGGCTPPSSSRSYTRDSYYDNVEFGDYPVVNVNWYQANAYCEWAGRKLPSEAQWEKAARGTDGRLYPWGDIFDGALVNFCDVNCPLSHMNISFDDGYADTAPAGNYPAGKSIYGAFDMAGSVWEWVNDWYSSDYYQGSSSSNPSGPISGSHRILRGGSWNNHGNGVRSVERSRSDPADAYGSYGFRCSLSHP